MVDVRPTVLFVPESAKEGSVVFQNNRCVAAAAWSIGGRDYMQDSFSIGLNHSVKGKVPVDFVGIFDGHGTDGENVSRVVAKYLCEEVLMEYEKTGQFEQSIETACFNLDAAIRVAPELQNDDDFVTGGSTCCCCWIMGSTIYVANVGDSRCILSYGKSHKCIEVTLDQKPTTKKEILRIEKAGGYVSRKRVNGGLGVARSFGDYKYKDNPKLEPWEQLVIVMPDIYTVVLDERINYLLLASDGVWDVKTSAEAVQTFTKESKAGYPCNLAAMKVVKDCISPTSDNTTMVALLLNDFAVKERAKHNPPRASKR